MHMERNVALWHQEVLCTMGTSSPAREETISRKGKAAVMQAEADSLHAAASCMVPCVLQAPFPGITMPAIVEQWLRS